MDINVGSILKDTLSNINKFFFNNFKIFQFSFETYFYTLLFNLIRLAFCRLLREINCLKVDLRLFTSNNISLISSFTKKRGNKTKPLMLFMTL